MAYESMALATRLWIKGKHFSIAQLLGEHYHASWENCSVCVSRLAPTDYHRFHMPCAATLKSSGDIQGDYYSVKPVRPLRLRPPGGMLVSGKPQVDLCLH